MKNIEVRCQHCNELLTFTDDLQKVSCPNCGAEWAMSPGGERYQPAPGGEEFFLEKEARKMKRRNIIGSIGMILSFASMAYFIPAATQAPGSGSMAIVYFLVPIVLMFGFLLYGFGLSKIRGVKVAEVQGELIALPMAPVNPAPAQQDDSIRKIQDLANLHRQGILTQEEFDRKKEELLSRI